MEKGAFIYNSHSSICFYIPEGLILYSSTLLALIAQIASWVYKTKIESLNSLAHDLHNIHIIAMAYDKIPSQFELSHLKYRVGLWVATKVKESKEKGKKEKGAEYFSDNLVKSNNKLKMMMHENSYWNHYLYKYTFERNLSRVIVALALIIIPTLFFIPLVNSSQNFDLARLIFSFLSFAILYEFLESTIRLKNASKAMLEIDNEISRNETLNEENLLNIFSQYVHLTRTVPSIPNKLYEKYRNMLNKGWGERFKEIT